MNTRKIIVYKMLFFKRLSTGLKFNVHPPFANKVVTELERYYLLHLSGQNCVTIFIMKF
jgi:hypothetical protein